MPMQLFPQLQAPAPALDQMAETGARMQFYRATAAERNELTQKQQALDKAVSDSIEPDATGKPQLNPEKYISNLYNVNPEAAEVYKQHYLDSQMKQIDFDEKQTSTHVNNMMNGLLMVKAGAPKEGIDLINQVPGKAKVLGVQQLDKDNYLVTHSDGEKETINMPSYIESLQTAKDLYAEQAKFKLEMIKQQKQLKADMITAGVYVQPNGMKVKMSDMTGAYKAASDRVLANLLDPQKALILKATNPDKYAELQKEATDLKDYNGWVKKNFGVDLSGQQPANAIPGEKVGGKPGSMVAKTPGGTSPKPLDLPKAKEGLEDGKTYQTSRGPAKWNAEKQVFEKP